MARYGYDTDYVDGVFVVSLTREPDCLNGDYLPSHAYPILKTDGLPLSPTDVAEMNPTVDNIRRLKTGHYRLMILPSEIIAKIEEMTDWRKGDCLPATYPYDFAVVWNWQAAYLSIYAPYQVGLGIDAGELSFVDALKSLKQKVDSGEVEERIKEAEGWWEYWREYSKQYEKE